MVYELMYIIPSKFSDAEVENVKKEVEGAFEKHGAKALKAESLGKLKFAYPIGGFTHGSYMLTYIELEGEKLADLDGELKLMPEVLRHIFVKREKGIPEFDYKLSSYEAPLTSEGKRTRGKPARSEAAPVRKEEAPVSAKELDKKLDEILESDIVSDV